MIIWLIGISGAGKTTIGRKLEANIKRIILGAYLLDRNGIVGIVCNISPPPGASACPRPAEDCWL